MMPSSGWIQVGKRGTGRPCAICQRMDWCRETRDGAIAHCKRIGDGSFRRSSKEGWYHRLTAAADAPRQAPIPRTAPIATTTIDFPKLARRFTRQLTQGRLDHLAGKLGLSPASLRRLHTGWATAADLTGTGTGCRGEGVWTFPMSAADGTTIGIRTRTVDGNKFAVTGSAGDGLFIPSGLGDPDTLLMPEGPTSTAALLQLNFSAVGRPNNRAGASHAAGLIRRLRPRRVVIVGDNDPKPDGTWPGLDGAEAFAADVATVCRQCRVLLTIMLPPAEIKDARQWLRQGATVLAVHRAVQASTPYTHAGRRSA